MLNRYVTALLSISVAWGLLICTVGCKKEQRHRDDRSHDEEHSGDDQSYDEEHSGDDQSDDEEHGGEHQTQEGGVIPVYTDNQPKEPTVCDDKDEECRLLFPTEIFRRPAGTWTLAAASKVTQAAVSPGKDAATKVTQAAVSPGKDAATKVIPAAVSPGKDAATKVTQAAVSPGKDAATKVIPAAAPPGDGWVLIVPGSFTMGSPTSEVGRYSRETQHEVRITQGFYLQKTEVTQAQYQALMGNNPSGFSSCGASCPVEQVNWLDALKYANALSRKDGLAECYVVEKRIGRSAVLHYQIKGIDIYDVGGESAIVKAQSGNPLNCRGYRLPTESEWEYAARAGSQASAYGPLDEVAWYDRNSNNTIHPVAEKRPNVFGLYDMLGNVWEWTWDWYGSYPGGSVTNPIGPKSGTERVFRGGSWGNEFGRLDYPDLPDVRAAFATARRPSFRNSDVGIRLARSAGPVPARPPAKVKEAPL